MQDNHSIKTVEIQFANAQLLPEIVKLLEEGHTVTLLLRGYSMRPFLEDNRDKASKWAMRYWQKSATDITCFIASSRFRTGK